MKREATPIINPRLRAIIHHNHCHLGVQPMPDEHSNQSDDASAAKTPGLSVGVGVALGTGVGTALGAALGNIGVGVAIGASIGVAIGAAFEVMAKGSGK